jgi:hypothetical protein
VPRTLRDPGADKTLPINQRRKGSESPQRRLAFEPAPEPCLWGHWPLTTSFDLSQSISAEAWKIGTGFQRNQFVTRKVSGARGDQVGTLGDQILGAAGGLRCQDDSARDRRFGATVKRGRSLSLGCLPRPAARADRLSLFFERKPGGGALERVVNQHPPGRDTGEARLRSNEVACPPVNELRPFFQTAR